MSYPTMSDYEDTGFGKFKLKKILKKVTAPVAKIVQKVTAKGPLKAVKKIVRKVAAVQAGVLTAGLVKPKFVGIKSKTGKKIFRVTGGMTKAVGLVVGGIILAPLVGPALMTAASSVGGAISSAGSATLGALKFVGGKLVSAPSSLMNALKGKGLDPATATPDQVIQAGQETGAISPSMLEQFAQQYMGQTGSLPSGYPTEHEAPEYPGGEEYPSRPEEEGAPVSESGMFGGGSFIPILYLGAGFLALMLFGGKKGRS